MNENTFGFFTPLAVAGHHHSEVRNARNKNRKIVKPMHLILFNLQGMDMIGG